MTTGNPGEPAQKLDRRELAVLGALAGAVAGSTGPELYQVARSFGVSSGVFEWAAPRLKKLQQRGLVERTTEKRLSAFVWRITATGKEMLKASTGDAAEAVPDAGPRRMTPDEFVSTAQRIVNALGRPRTSVFQNGLEFEDGPLRIRTNFNGLGLEVTRLRIEKPGYPELAQTTNPVAMVAQDGSIIRLHGEHVHLLERMSELDARLAPAQTAR